jgi:plasmid stabilization system protein ParE
MIVRILPAAEAELEAIGDYIARDNPRRALSFVLEMRDRCMSLADMPLAYPLVPLLRREQFEVQEMSLSRDRRGGISEHDRA